MPRPKKPDTPAPQTPPETNTGAIAPVDGKPKSAIFNRNEKGQIVPGGSTGGSNDTNKNGTAGAPTLYRPEYCDRIVDYFTVAEFSERVIKSESTGKNDFSKTEYIRVPKDLPTMEGFADEIGVSVDALRDWKDAKEEDGETLRYPDFHRAYMRAQGKQKQMLVINGLGGLYPPSFAIFVAQNFTEMRDKTAVDHTTQGKAMPAPQVYLPEDLPDEYFDKQKQDAEKAAADNPQR